MSDELRQQHTDLLFSAPLDGEPRQRFGELPGEVSERIEHAHPDQLEAWSERIFAADSLDQVFA